MATILSQGCRNPKFPTGGSGFINYGGSVAAVGNGVADDTQAILEVLNLGRGGPGGAARQQAANPVQVFLPTGTYNVTKMIQLWENTWLFSDPSAAAPTIVLQSGSAFFQTTDAPFVVTNSLWNRPEFSTDWTSRDGVTYASTNTVFMITVDGINFRVKTGNAHCICVFMWAMAQQGSFRNSVLTRDDAVGDCFRADLNGGGGSIYAVTTNGGANAANFVNSSYQVCRACVWNGPVRVPFQWMLNFIACTFNNPTGAGFVWETSSFWVGMVDCPFTAGTPFTPNSAVYHLENSANQTQLTGGTGASVTGVYYNGVLESGNNANLAVAGVIKGSPYPNPAYPQPSAACVLGTGGAFPLNADPTGVADSSNSINTALANNAEVYLPAGNYRCLSTITVPAGKKLFGVPGRQTNLVALGSPGVSLLGRGVAGVVLRGIAIGFGSTGTAMQWNADQTSQVLDCSMTGPIDGLNIDFQSGGGLIENMWAPDYNNAGVENAVGMRIASTDPLALYSFAPEHHITGVQFVGAQNVYLMGVQYENSTLNMNMSGCSAIYMHGSIGGNHGINEPFSLDSTTSTYSAWGTMCSNIVNLIRDRGTLYGTGIQADGQFTPLPGLTRPSTVANTIPSVSASAATGIGTTSATLNGSIVSTGNQTITSDGFDWGTTTAYGNTAAATTVQSGAFSANLTVGLSASTTYHFRSRAANASGTGFSGDNTFTTLSAPTIPSVDVSAATSITSSSATLNGSIVSTGGQAITSDGFDWGTTTAYGNTAAATTVQSGAFTANISGLTNGQTYHFRSKAVNASGTGVSSDLSFIAITKPYVQGTFVVGGQSGAVTSVAVPYGVIQTTGNSNIVAISFNSVTATVLTVTDSRGNIYTEASPIVRSTSDSQTIWWCKSITATAGSNTVTVNLSVASGYISVRIAEYHSLGSIDVHSESSGVGGTASVPTTTTTNSGDLIVVAVAAGDVITATSAGYVEEPNTAGGVMNCNPFGSDLQDRSPGITGGWTASTTLGSSQSWVENFVAFLPAGSPVSVPTNTLATTLSSSSIKVDWAASTGGSGIIHYLVWRNP